MGPEDHTIQLERTIRCDGATLEEARAKAREICGLRTVLREVVLANGGLFTARLSAESEGRLQERERQAIPAGAIVKTRRMVHPSPERLVEEAFDEDEVRAILREVRPQHRVISIVCHRQPVTGVLGILRRPGEYLVTAVDTQLRSEVTYEVRACIEVVASVTATDCLAILHEPASPEALERARAAARLLAQHADTSNCQAIFDALDRFRRDDKVDQHVARDVRQDLARALERIARSPAGFEAVAEQLAAPDAAVRDVARNILLRLENVAVPPAALKHMQKYEEQQSNDARASLEQRDPFIARDRFCLDLLRRLAGSELRIAADRDELADWCRDCGLTKAEGETLARALVSAGLAEGPRQDSVDRPTHVLFGITDSGRSVIGASLFAR